MSLHHCLLTALSGLSRYLLQTCFALSLDQKQLMLSAYVSMSNARSVILFGLAVGCKSLDHTGSIELGQV